MKEGKYGLKLQTVSGLQEGIYHFHNDYPRNSLAIVFLRLKQPSEAYLVRRTLSQLWQRYSELKKGFAPHRNIQGQDQRLGALSVLIGYGPKFFETQGLEKKKPDLLTEKWLFTSPTYPRTPILPDVGLKYGQDVTRNEVADDHILIQFIGETQVVTHRAVVETWKVLGGADSNESSAPLFMRSFCTGFNHSDGRGWLGFHEGISNIRNSDRLKAIQIDKRTVKATDFWTATGTYLAYIKIAIDLTIWESISEKEQERIVGRQKSTGCPLIGTDNRGINLFARGCPVPGTRQMTEKGNERFREYPTQRITDGAAKESNSKYPKSHVQLMRTAPDRIFRQGYEFLEPSVNYPYLRAGLHFISFQSGTDKIIKTIRYGFGKTNFGGPTMPWTDKLLSVQEAGIFLVPPVTRNQDFPGDIIFQKGSKLVARNYGPSGRLDSVRR